MSCRPDCRSASRGNSNCRRCIIILFIVFVYILSVIYLLIWYWYFRYLFFFYFFSEIVFIYFICLIHIVFIARSVLAPAREPLPRNPLYFNYLLFFFYYVFIIKIYKNYVFWRFCYSFKQMTEKCFGKLEKCDGWAKKQIFIL